MQGQPGGWILAEGGVAYGFQGRLQRLLTGGDLRQFQGQGLVVVAEPGLKAEIGAGQGGGHQHHFPALVDLGAKGGEGGGGLLGQH